MMNESCDKSAAFQQALLKSERLRILIVIWALGAAFLVRTLRTVVLHNQENLKLWMLTVAFLVLILGYEFLMLRAVNRSMQGGRRISNAVWIINIILESCLPAFVLMFESSEAIEAAYRPLANPVVLVFFVFIILSTLRLNPVACRLSGAVSAASYLAAALYLGWRPTLDGGASLLAPEKSVVAYAVILVVAGFVAGAVAGEIRKQVEAALLEAEMQRQVERLEHDLSVARSIQQSLLPTSMPEIEGFDIAAWNQPADQTGGDYYDWLPLPDGKVLVALGDVTGHGIGSALLAAVDRKSVV
jgi:K+-sensing histidine kinase KdpD